METLKLCREVIFLVSLAVTMGRTAGYPRRQNTHINTLNSQEVKYRATIVVANEKCISNVQDAIKIYHNTANLCILGRRVSILCEEGFLLKINTLTCHKQSGRSGGAQISAVNKFNTLLAADLIEQLCLLDIQQLNDNCAAYRQCLETGKKTREKCYQGSNHNVSKRQIKFLESVDDVMDGDVMGQENRSKRQIKFLSKRHRKRQARQIKFMDSQAVADDTLRRSVKELLKERQKRQIKFIDSESVTDSDGQRKARGDLLNDRQRRQIKFLSDSVDREFIKLYSPPAYIQSDRRKRQIKFLRDNSAKQNMNRTKRQIKFLRDNSVKQTMNRTKRQIKFVNKDISR